MLPQPRLADVIHTAPADWVFHHPSTGLQQCKYLKQTRIEAVEPQGWWAENWCNWAVPATLSLYRHCWERAQCLQDAEHLPSVSAPIPYHRKYLHFVGLLFGSLPITLVYTSSLQHILISNTDTRLLTSALFQLLSRASWVIFSSHMASFLCTFARDKNWQIKFSKTPIYMFSFPVLIVDVNHGLIVNPAKQEMQRVLLAKDAIRELNFLAI